MEDVDAAEDALDEAEDDAEDAGCDDGGTDPECEPLLAAAQARVRSAEAGVEAAELAVAELTVRAPAAGVVVA